MRAMGITAGVAGARLIVTASLLAGYGWLYVLRGAGWLGGSPRVGDSLPLAGFDGSSTLHARCAS